MYKAQIAGVGSFLPSRKLTNSDLEKTLDTSHEWIVERTGIWSRRIAEEGQGPSDLAFFAVEKALKSAQKTPQDVDAILFATVTPDYTMPSSASYLQAKLGCRNILAMDLGAACSGFLYGLTLAQPMIQTGQYENILVVGAETLHHKVDYRDRSTCILFGDGAGAALVTRAQPQSESYIYSCHGQCDGSLAHLLQVPGGGSIDPFSQEVLDERRHYVTMNGREIFKHAVRTMLQCCRKALEDNQIGIDHVDWLIPHQANIRIMEALAKHLQIPMGKVLVSIKDSGNTSAATIPIALESGIREGKIKKGQTLLLTSFGAGLTSGGILLKY